MALERTLRLAVDPQVRPETLPLHPQEYFVLSRVEGRLTVGEIIGASGLGTTATEQILERLLDLGALIRVEQAEPPIDRVERVGRVATPTPGGHLSASASVSAPGPVLGVPPRKRQTTQELRAQAQDRRRRMLQQQLVASRTPTPAPVPPGPGSSGPPMAVQTAPGALRAPPVPPEPEPEPEPEPAPTIEPVPPDDPRVDPSLGLSTDDQRWLLAIEDRLPELTPFELLGLRPTHDLKAIRVAFRDASRRLHPDAYHGRALGRYQALLSTLFARAKAAHAALQDESTRAPWVAAVEAERAERRLRAQQQEAARRAAHELRQRREQEAEAERRAARAAQRAERERERLASAVRAKIAEYLQAAADAEAMDNHARAANNYRLAMQLDPSDDELRGRWHSARARARTRRAKDAFARACTLVEAGHHAEAVPLFLEAAEADPTLEHLAHAADAAREHDPARARDLALHALGRLAEDEHAQVPLRPAVVAELRLMIGRAFLAAGQAESAAEQARLVLRLRPADPQARALLNSAKVT